MKVTSKNKECLCDEPTCAKCLANIFESSKIKKDTSELSSMRNASAQDILKDLGPQSKEEYEYYKNL